MNRNFFKIILLSLVTALTMGCASTSKRQANGSLVADSEVFDANGYYFPVQNVIIKGYKLDCFELHMLEYYYDGKLNYENPRLIPPEAKIWLLDSTKDSTLVLPCTQTLITRDTIDLFCPTTPVGAIRIRGSFLDRRGQFWNNSDVTPQKKAVVYARVLIKKQGEKILNKDVKFTYWEGD